MQAWLGLVGGCDADSSEPGGPEQIGVFALGEGAVGAAGPLLRLGALGRVEIIVGDDVADPQAAAGRGTRNASARVRGLSVDRLITQLEMTTSTLAPGSGMSSMWPSRLTAQSA